MRTFNKQAASLKKSLKQNNLMPLFVVFSFIVMLSLTYKSVSKVNGVGNTMFKEGNRNRRRRVRQGFREGNEDDEEEEHFEEGDETTVEGVHDVGGAESSGGAESAPEEFLNGGGIGRKAGFVGKGGMTASMRKAHINHHKHSKRLKNVIYNANKKRVDRNVRNIKWDRRGGVPPPRPPPPPYVPPSQRRPTHLDKPKF